MKCDDCKFSKVMPQEDGIDALECRNPKEEDFDTWVSGNDVCKLCDKKITEDA